MRGKLKAVFKYLFADSDNSRDLPCDGSSSVGTVPRLGSNWLQWPVDRSSRTFRVYVVEPRKYSPGTHGEIFNAALTSLVNPEHSRIDPYVKERVTNAVEPFDLVTFPEAFLPKDDLLQFLEQLPAPMPLGCVHVGLRPSAAANGHLFNTVELRQMVDSLDRIRQVHKDDLYGFSNWLDKQHPESRYNIGCLFTVDARQNVRVCLHPKLVRSKYETSALHDGNMTEADLVTLVTLQPEDKSFLSTILQPLICSDVLFADTDRPFGRPLEAISTYGGFLQEAPPDHVDIISVVTCTPQNETDEAPLGQHRRWHQQFLSSFVRVASELARHHYSSFVLSNFLEANRLPGGLSGVFLPVPLRYYDYPPFVTISAWGRNPNGSDKDNRWSPPSSSPPDAKAWSSRGYIASLDSRGESKNALARMLGITIDRLPRHSQMAHWGGHNGLVNFELRKTMVDPDNGEVFFEREV